MGQIVGRHLNSYLVTGQDFDEIHTELAGNVCQNDVPIADVDIEHCVGQCIGYDAFNLDYVVFCQVNNLQVYFAVANLNQLVFFGDGEYFRLPVGDEYSILIVGGELAVGGDCGPAVFQHLNIIDTGVDHWFNCQGHSGQ